VKKKQKGKEKQPGQNPSAPNNFPYGWLIGGGIVIGILLLLVLILLVKVKKGKK
jgi:hypothetical protein